MNWEQFHFAGSASRRQMRVEGSSSSASWPQSWTLDNLKGYSRFTWHKLLRAGGQNDARSVREVMRERRSGRHGNSRKITIEDMGALLDMAASQIGSSPARYPYPSAGARHPVEIYILTGQADHFTIGHYDAADHGFFELPGRIMRDYARQLFGFDWIAKAQAILVLTIIPSRSTIKYGQRGYRYALIEAGHIMQNLVLAAASENLQACPVGGFADAATARALGTIGESEYPAYCLVFPEVEFRGDEDA